MLRLRQQSLLLFSSVILVALAPSASAARQRPRRRNNELGKFADGRPTEIDCSASQYNFEYYIERCHDIDTQWWINGHCTDGEKTEISEYHLCMKPNGSRPYCHDCNDGSGNIKNVCGSDSDDKELVCGIVLEGTAKDCGDEGLTVYSHQCEAPQDEGGKSTEMWYLRESFYCDEEEVYEGNDDTFQCGQEWFYPHYENEDYPWLDVDSSHNDGHPFSFADNKYCLDCGMSIQVCAGDADATCENLGLPPKGQSSPVSSTLAVPAVVPAPAPEVTVPAVAVADPQNDIPGFTWEELPDDTDNAVTSTDVPDEQPDSSEKDLTAATIAATTAATEPANDATVTVTTDAPVETEETASSEDNGPAPAPDDSPADAPSPEEFAPASTQSSAYVHSNSLVVSAIVAGLTLSAVV